MYQGVVVGHPVFIYYYFFFLKTIITFVLNFVRNFRPENLSQSKMHLTPRAPLRIVLTPKRFSLRRPRWPCARSIDLYLSHSRTRPSPIGSFPFRERSSILSASLSIRARRHLGRLSSPRGRKLHSHVLPVPISLFIWEPERPFEKPLSFEHSKHFSSLIFFYMYIYITKCFFVIFYSFPDEIVAAVCFPFVRLDDATASISLVHSLGKYTRFNSS